MRRNRVKFGLTTQQIKRLEQHERYVKVCNHISLTSSLPSPTQQKLKKYMLMNIHQYLFADENLNTDENNYYEYDKDNENNCYVYIQEYLQQLSQTEIDSREENKILKHLFSIHLPKTVLKQHGLQQSVGAEHEEASDMSDVDVDNIEYPMSAPTESINTPEYRKEKKQKLTELIQLYTSH